MALKECSSGGWPRALSRVSKLWHKALLTSNQWWQLLLPASSCVVCALPWLCCLVACRWLPGWPLAWLRLLSCSWSWALVCVVLLFAHIHNYQLRRFARHKTTTTTTTTIAISSSTSTSGVATGCTQVLLCHCPLSCALSCRRCLFDNVYRCKFQSELLFYRLEKCCNTQAVLKPFI